MSRKTRSNLAVGLLLILLGAWFLAVQIVPSLGAWFWMIFEWPVIIIIVGLCLLVFGLLIGAPDMVVPAAIVGGIGGLLYWQNATGDWESWAYAWTLIPGFVGVGVVLAAMLGEGGRKGYRSGGTLIFISLVMFAIFGALFGANPLGTYWPVLLIALGLWMLVQPLFRRKP